jgi:hypothetical protein
MVNISPLHEKKLCNAKEQETPRLRKTMSEQTERRSLAFPIPIVVNEMAAHPQHELEPGRLALEWKVLDSVNIYNYSKGCLRVEKVDHIVTAVK